MSETKYRKGKKLLIGLHNDQHGRFDPYLQIYEHILDHNGIKHLRLESSQPDFWDIVSNLDLIIFHWVYIDRDQQMAESLIPIIEKEMGIRCFPNWSTFWHYNNKIAQYYLLRSHNFSLIDSYIFWERDDAEKWIDDAEFPLVFKLNRGALSQDVVLVNDRKQAKQLISRMFSRGIKPGSLAQLGNYKLTNQYKTLRNQIWVFKQKLLGRHIELKWKIERNYVLFQKFLSENPYTTRITVIGNKAFAFNIKTVEDDFRAHDMQQVSFDQKEIDIECIKISFKISNTFGFQCMAYDFLFNEKHEPRVCEIGYTSYALDIYQCPGYWDSDLNWHEGHYWPQFFQLVDLLNLTELKQPRIDIDSLN